MKNDDDIIVCPEKHVCGSIKKQHSIVLRKQALVNNNISDLLYYRFLRTPFSCRNHRRPCLMC